MHAKNKRRKGKTTESRKVVMQNMRTLAGIYIKFREIGQSKNMQGLKLRNLFCRSDFNMLEQALDELLLDGKKIKAGAKTLAGNVLKRTVKIFKGCYLIKNLDETANELEKFNDVLCLRWNFLFAEAECQSICRRQELLRLPEQLPLEDDVFKV